MSTLERLSDKISEVYDLELQEELTGIFKDVVDELWVLSAACERERIKLEALEKCSDVQHEMYCKKCDELDKVEEEKEQAEYDRDYHEKYSKELLREINRE